MCPVLKKMLGSALQRSVRGAGRAHNDDIMVVAIASSVFLHLIVVRVYAIKRHD